MKEVLAEYAGRSDFAESLEKLGKRPKARKAEVSAECREEEGKDRS